MQLEQEIVLVLQTQRTNIARECQAAARSEWCSRPKADFGRGTEIYEAITTTLNALENSLREHYRPGGYRPEARDAILQRTAERWEALPLAWSDVRRLIIITGDCTQQALSHAGLRPEAERACALDISTILEACAGKRIATLEAETATTREQAVLSQHLAGRFISNASHDLRTPLTAILGFSELLAEESYGPLTPEQANAVGHVFNSAQNLLEIVNNLLDIIQIQAGKLSLRCKRIEIAPVLRAVYGLLASLAERRKVEFTIDVSDELGTMNMDENIVRHIVYHLLSSALRSTPTGGKVSLAAERTSSRLTLITTDTALKLPQEAIDNMLGMVPLLENSPVRGYEGWEVGLALVRRYVELHEGAMEIDNRSEQGTIFRVTFPTGITAG